VRPLSGSHLSKRILMKIYAKALVVVAVLALLTGCASSSKSGTNPSATPTATVSPASLICQPSQLQIQMGVGDAAMGTVGYAGMGFKNISTSTCTLTGYPALQMLDANGANIPTFSLHIAPYAAPAGSKSTATLAPGQVAKFDMQFHSQTGYGNLSCPTSAKVAFTAPGDTAPVTIAWKLQPYGGSTIQTLRCGEIKVSPIYSN